MKNVIIRKGKPEDIHELSELALIVLNDMELPLVQELGEEKTLKLISQCAKDPEYRYSPNRAIVAEVNGEVAGALFGYPNEDEDLVDDALNEISIKPLFFTKETYNEEWYIDTLVVSPKYRGMGLAKKLIAATKNSAQHAKKDVIGLNVDITNKNAKKLYDSIGFCPIAELTIANHKYIHMYWDYKK